MGVWPYLHAGDARSASPTLIVESRDNRRPRGNRMIPYCLSIAWPTLRLRIRRHPPLALAPPACGVRLGRMAHMRRSADPVPPRFRLSEKIIGISIFVFRAASPRLPLRRASGPSPAPSTLLRSATARPPAPPGLDHHHGCSMWPGRANGADLASTYPYPVYPVPCSADHGSRVGGDGRSRPDTCVHVAERRRSSRQRFICDSLR